jgi:hypothetical protein
VATPARIEANRHNALLSTGPRTSEGKAVSRWNAVRHGLSARCPVLPGESPEAYEALQSEVRRELRPEGVVEEVFASRIGDRIWRLARVSRLETGILLWLVHSPEVAPGSRDPQDIIEFLRGPRDPGSSTHGQESESAALLREDAVQLGKALIRDASEADALSKLSRHETRLERGLIRDLRELERLQCARRLHEA